MTLSIIVITANPTEKQYAWREALASYSDLADEVVVVDGGTEVLEMPHNGRLIHVPDPEVWNWAEHAKRLNLGLKEATGDWVIKCDIDWMFHENDRGKIREKLSRINQQIAVATFQKKTFYPFRKYLQKGSVPIAIRKEFKDKVKFGKDPDSYTDLTYPIYWDGTFDEHGVELGKLVREYEWAKTGETVWNFDYTFKTFDVAKKMFLRGSQAHKVYYGESNWGEDEEQALQAFLANMRGKTSKAIPMDINILPKYILPRIENIKPEEFGHSGWGML